MTLQKGTGRNCKRLVSDAMVGLLLQPWGRDCTRCLLPQLRTVKADLMSIMTRPHAHEMSKPAFEPAYLTMHTGMYLARRKSELAVCDVSVRRTRALDVTL